MRKLFIRTSIESIGIGEKSMHRMWRPMIRREKHRRRLAGIGRVLSARTTDADATARARLITSLSTWIRCSSRSLNAVHPKHTLPATMPWREADIPALLRDDILALRLQIEFAIRYIMTNHGHPVILDLCRRSWLGADRRQQIRPRGLVQQHSLATARRVDAGPGIEHRHLGRDELGGVTGNHHELLKRGDWQPRTGRAGEKVWPRRRPTSSICRQRKTTSSLTSHVRPRTAA